MKKNICGEELASPVDPKNDKEMVEAGIRKPLLFINRWIFKKSIPEKVELKRKKNKVSPKGAYFEKAPKYNQKFKLVVYMKYSQQIKNFKSTHSFECYENEIPTILRLLKDEGYIINKVFFNNKTYKK